MKILGGVVVGLSLFLFIAIWTVSTDLGWMPWLIFLHLLGVGLLAYGIHLDRKNKSGP